MHSFVRQQSSGLLQRIRYDVVISSTFLRRRLTPLLQPIQALEHPSFQNMIDIAARATKGVKIPNRKQTRDEIINTFKRNLSKLRDRLNVSAPHLPRVLRVAFLTMRTTRARQSPAKSTSRVMHGKHQTPTATLRLLVTGSRRFPLVCGSFRVHFSVSSA